MRKAAHLILICLIFSKVDIAISAEPSDPCVGEWRGLIDASVQEFELSLTLRRVDANQCSGTLDIPERDVANAPLRNLRIENGVISFTAFARGNELTFRGVLNDRNQIIEGKFRQATYSLPFKLVRGSEQPIRRHVEPPPITLRDVVGAASDRASIASPEHPAIRYTTDIPTDAIAKLNREIGEGKISLKFDGIRGYLESALNVLNIATDSQTLVFSKTSVQAHLINPGNPRALYFRDDVTVGYIRNAPFLEFASVDPSQGVIFYTLDQTESASPQFVRRNNCLSCHLSRNTMGVPGLRLRSVATGPSGKTFDHFGDYRVDDRTPFPERWGGWYVTGTAKSMTHLGNIMLVDSNNFESPMKAESPSVASLAGRFPTEAYPSSTSDIVPLMVYEHQAQMTNLLVRMAWDARAALYMKDSATNRDMTAKLLTNNAEEIVDYLLFVDEALLPGAIVSSSNFAQSFSAQGPRDGKGRSLRELDLQKRLMRYPCSYMVYSDAFSALPIDAKAAIYKRMWQILSGSEKNPKYSRLSTQDKRAVVEILRDTKNDLPTYFK